MDETPVAVSPSLRTSLQSALTYSLLGVVALHAAVLAIWSHSAVGASRILTAAVPALAALSVAWRAHILPERERIAWRWLSLAMLFWSAAQVVEAGLGQSRAASNLTADPSDFLYIAAAFPLLLAVSSTKETESIHAVVFLDFAQVTLALVLTWVRLFDMTMPAAEAASEMSWIYGTECVLLAVAAGLRLATWSTREELRRVRMLCGVLWLYLPIELAMDYGTRHWKLESGTMLDLVWSLPFFYGGWKALRMPIDTGTGTAGKPLSRSRLMVESLCPLLFTVGVFALAASVTRLHPVLAFAAALLLFLIQGLHAGLVQSSFLAGKRLLLEREQELQTANSTLRQLSMLDPLTGIPNRRRFAAAFEEAWKRAIRTKESVAVLMIDVDYFKGVNDLHGHTYGDECLKSVARALGHSGRSNDLLARYGGEEFVLLLPETSAGGAMTVAERIHRAVAGLRIKNDASPFDGLLTVSVGLGVTSPRLGMNAADLVDLADQAMYAAKRDGRNRICARTLGDNVAVEQPAPGSDRRD